MADNEGKLQLLVQLPASLKIKFDDDCKENGRSMTDVVIELISGYLD